MAYVEQKQDRLALRRWLAIISAFHGLFIFPYVVAWCSFHKITDSLCEAMLVYMQVLTTPILGAYLYAAHVQQQQDIAPTVNTTVTTKEG